MPPPTVCSNNGRHFSGYLCSIAQNDIYGHRGYRRSTVDNLCVPHIVQPSRSFAARRVPYLMCSQRAAFFIASNLEILTLHQEKNP